MSGASVVVTREGVLGIDLVGPERLFHTLQHLEWPHGERLKWPPALDHTLGTRGGESESIPSLNGTEMLGSRQGQGERASQFLLSTV